MTHLEDVVRDVRKLTRDDPPFEYVVYDGPTTQHEDDKAAPPPPPLPAPKNYSRRAVSILLERACRDCIPLY